MLSQNKGQFPLGFEFEGNLLEASVQGSVRAVGHETGVTYDGSESGGGEFNFEWE